jgi:four helix bundle protein
MEEAARPVKVQNFTDLRVWQAAMDLAEQIYRLTWTFPRQEQYGLSSQLQRCAVSIPSNIAEGHSRNQTGEYLRLLAIARGSAAEVKTQILLAMRLAYLDQEKGQQILRSIDELLKQITALRTAIQRFNEAQ